MKAADLQLPTWIEIDLDSLSSNLAAVRAELSPTTELMAVVKADAYGQGAAGVAQEFYRQGVKAFAVSFVHEAEALRKIGIDAEILVFVPPLTDAELVRAVDLNLTVTLSDFNDLERLIKQAEHFPLTLKVEIKVDSGLHRFGLRTGEEIAEVYHALAELPSIEISGIYTHMAYLAHKSITRQQFNRFMEILQTLERNEISFARRHCAGSAVWLKYPEMSLDMVRLGTVLSGQFPLTEHKRRLSLKDPYTYKSRIISFQDLPKGTAIGYGHSYRLRQNARIAVVPVGYRDGLATEVVNPPASFKELLKKMLKNIFLYYSFRRFILHIKIGDESYPVRGKVFMQMALVELPQGFPVNIGQEVSLPVRKTLTGEQARLFVRAGEVEAQIDRWGNYQTISK